MRDRDLVGRRIDRDDGVAVRRRCIDAIAARRTNETYRIPSYRNRCHDDRYGERIIDDGDLMIGEACDVQLVPTRYVEHGVCAEEERDRARDRERREIDLGDRVAFEFTDPKALTVFR